MEWVVWPILEIGTRLSLCFIRSNQTQTKYDTTFWTECLLLNVVYMRRQQSHFFGFCQLTSRTSLLDKLNTSLLPSYCASCCPPPGKRSLTISRIQAGKTTGPRTHKFSRWNCVAIMCTSGYMSTSGLATAILDLSLSVRSDSIVGITGRYLDPKNIGLAVGIALLSWLCTIRVSPWRSRYSIN